MASEYKSQARYYMATLSDGFAQFFPDLRRFIVMAKGKLGLNSQIALITAEIEAAFQRRDKSERGRTTIMQGYLSHYRMMIEKGVNPGLV